MYRATTHELVKSEWIKISKKKLSNFKWKSNKFGFSLVRQRDLSVIQFQNTKWQLNTFIFSSFCIRYYSIEFALDQRRLHQMCIEWCHNWFQHANQSILSNQMPVFDVANIFAGKLFLLNFWFYCFDPCSAHNSHRKKIIFYFLLLVVSSYGWSETNICGYALRLTNTENV